ASPKGRPRLLPPLRLRGFAAPLPLPAVALLRPLEALARLLQVRARSFELVARDARVFAGAREALALRRRPWRRGPLARQIT
ncbi:MAG TPA: hypothetical protein VIY73_10265, partial [Polyangiaceae bacterium]